MNKRLRCIYNEISGKLGVIDVGTDHGYIPVQLALDGFQGNIIAADINAGPLDAAKRSAALRDVGECISFRLSDGLDCCSADEIDTIIIAGMGGDTICGILDRAEWCMDGRYQLILQPMTKAEILRYWLENNGFYIEKELISEEPGELYQIIVSRFGQDMKLSDGELFAGRQAVSLDKTLYARLLDSLIRRHERIVYGLEKSGVNDDPRLELAREFLASLMELRRAYDNDK